MYMWWLTSLAVQRTDGRSRKEDECNGYCFSLSVKQSYGRTAVGSSVFISEKCVACFRTFSRAMVLGWCWWLCILRLVLSLTLLIHLQVSLCASPVTKCAYSSWTSCYRLEAGFLFRHFLLYHTSLSCLSSHVPVGVGSITGRSQTPWSQQWSTWHWMIIEEQRLHFTDTALCLRMAS